MIRWLETLAITVLAAAAAAGQAKQKVDVAAGLLEARQKKLRYVTLDVHDGTAESVLAQLRRQTGWPLFTPRGYDATRTVSVSGKQGLPLGAALAELGLAHAGPILRVPAANSTFVAVPGVTFTVRAVRWPKGGETAGVVIETKTWPTARGLVEWRVASVSGRDRPRLERCRLHSPGRVLARGATNSVLRVKMSGKVWWARKVPITFEAPAKGHTAAAGGFEVTLEWPDLVVRSRRPVPRVMLERAIGDIVCEPKPGIRFRDVTPSSGAVGLGGSARGRFDPRKPRAWCGCPIEPEAGKPARSETAREARRPIAEAESSYPLSAIARIRVELRMPERETFSETIRIEPTD